MTFSPIVTKRAVYLQDALLSGMYGLAVGDALGVPYESCSLEQMTASPCTAMIGFGQHQQPRGSWSDDTSMSLCIADSLCKGFNPDDMVQKFLLWKDHKQYTATGAAFDVGRQTRKALQRYADGCPADACGDCSVEGNGNGGLMRCFPIALYQCLQCQVDDEHLQEFLEPIHAVSRITHGHELGLICCGLYALVLREYLLFTKSEDTLLDIVERAYQKARSTYAKMGALFGKLISDSQYFAAPGEIKQRRTEELPTWGYVLNTWNITLWSLLNTNNYRDCVLKAINLGGDTDTNAAVVGSLAGVIYGKESIPTDWIDKLQNKRLLDLLCDKLNAKLFAKQKVISLIDRFEGDFLYVFAVRNFFSVLVLAWYAIL